MTTVADSTAIASATAPIESAPEPKPTSPSGTVTVLTLADGLVVRLAGAFGTGEAALLREALLRPRPAACKDILVDAGEVSSIDDEALAVLVAGLIWASRTGGQMSFTRMSDELLDIATSLGVLGKMQVLTAAGARTS